MSGMSTSWVSADAFVVVTRSCAVERSSGGRMTWGLVVVGVVEVVVVVVAGVVVASFCGSKKLKLNDAIVIGVGVYSTLYVVDADVVDVVWCGGCGGWMKVLFFPILKMLPTVLLVLLYRYW